MSRVPITPPSSSTGTLRAAQTPSPTSTWANSCPVGFDADVTDRGREPLAERHRTRPLGEAFLPVLDRLGGLVRGAGPAQLPLGVDQHEPGRVGPRTAAWPRRRPAAGSGPGPVLGPGCRGRRCSWPDRWGRSAWRCLPFWYGLTGYCRVLDATTGHASPARPAPAGQRRPASRSHRDALVGSTVWAATASSSPVRVSRSTSSRRRALNAPRATLGRRRSRAVSQRERYGLRMMGQECPVRSIRY